MCAKHRWVGENSLRFRGRTAKHSWRSIARSAGQIVSRQSSAIESRLQHTERSSGQHWQNPNGCLEQPFSISLKEEQPPKTPSPTTTKSRLPFLRLGAHHKRHGESTQHAEKRQAGHHRRQTKGRLCVKNTKGPDLFDVVLTFIVGACRST